MNDFYFAEVTFKEFHKKKKKNKGTEQTCMRNGFT